jgi:hypothetical protein
MRILCFLLFACVVNLQALQPGTITIESQKWVAVPTKHLRIEGTLNGDTPFYVLLPTKEAWTGRMIQWLSGGLGGRLTGDRGVADFALTRGSAFVESTQGHTGSFEHQSDDTLTEIMYEASYLAVQYAKSRCVELYGNEPRYTYVMGASGGGFRSTGLIERFPEVYDGAVASVGGGTLKLHWYYGSLFDYYRQPLLSKVDAMEAAVGVNGEGDPFPVLETPEQTEALRMILTAGWPKRLIGRLRKPFGYSSGALVSTKYKYDAAYFEDFWKLDGYAGRVVQDLIRERIQGTVKSADPSQSTLVIEAPEAPQDLFLYTLTFTSGKLAGSWRYVRSREGDELRTTGGPGLEGVAPGDRFELDNRDFLAYLHYHRHIADADEPAARDFYKNGKPIYPQRSDAAMRYLDETDRDVGNVQGKLITIFATDDPLDWPTIANRYHRKVRQHLGSGIDDHYRMYFVERSAHGGSQDSGGLRLVSKMGMIYRAYDDMLAWVEKGVSPPPSTQYTMDEMNQLILAPTAAERQGYQPVVRLLANGKEHRIEARAGEEIEFLVEAEDPDNELAQAEIDFHGDDRYDQTNKLNGKKAKTRFTHRYDRPGEHIAAVRVSDTTETAHCPVSNLAAVRVVVK